MSVREYIGARYVPLFADPLEWDSTKTYEPLTVVYYQGNSYTSRQAVPVGIEISNETYWALTGNYNAQIEQYRSEVQLFDNRISENTNAISDIESDIETLNDKFPIATSDIANNAITSAKIADGTITNGDIANGAINGIKQAGKYIACIGDSFGNAADEWPSILAAKFGYGLINECTNGAGLISTSYSARTFEVQLDAIKANAHLTNGNVEYIVVLGGVNDWNNANATATQVRDAVNSFMDSYCAISAAIRPKLIFAYGTVGYAKQDKYIGYDEWLSEISTLVNEGKNCTGWVENVCYWLMPEKGVFQSDNLHPNTAGEKIIASYLSQCISGTYSGVHKVITLTNVENATEGKVVVHFDNGVSSVTGKLKNASIDFSSGEYFRVANFGAYTFTFGDGSAGTQIENMFIRGAIYRIGSNSSGQMGIMRFVFNVKNGGVFLQVYGTKASLNIADNILTGSPDIYIGSGVGM